MPDEHKWTHTICCDCWDKKNPDRPTTAETRANDSGVDERCCYCGQHTRTGIYIRDSIDNTICDTFTEEVREVRTTPVHWQEAAYICHTQIPSFDMLTTPMQGMIVGALLDKDGATIDAWLLNLKTHHGLLAECDQLHQMHHSWGYEK